jgi:hypothetical protein
VYGNPTKVNNPIVLISTPSTVNQACKVPPDKAKGKPEKNPKNKTANTLGFKKSFIETLINKNF